jgi:hypothetical protein
VTAPKFVYLVWTSDEVSGDVLVCVAGTERRADRDAATLREQLAHKHRVSPSEMATWSGATPSWRMCRSGKVTGVLVQIERREVSR